MSKEYETFKKNLAQAEGILFLFEVKSKLDVLPRILKKPILPFLEKPIPGIIRDFLSEKGERVIDAVKPLMMVFLASCLEEYLKGVGKEDKLVRMIKNWEEKVGKELTRRMHEVRIKRNVVVHNAGRLGGNNIRDFNTHGIDTLYREGEELELDVNELRGMIANIKMYAEKIEEIR